MVCWQRRPGRIYVGFGQCGGTPERQSPQYGVISMSSPKAFKSQCYGLRAPGCANLFFSSSGWFPASFWAPESGTQHVDIKMGPPVMKHVNSHGVAPIGSGGLGGYAGFGQLRRQSCVIPAVPGKVQITVVRCRIAGANHEGIRRFRRAADSRRTFRLPKRGAACRQHDQTASGKTNHNHDGMAPHWQRRPERICWFCSTAAAPWGANPHGMV